MTEGALVAWKVRRRATRCPPGDVIAEVETDKATMEMEAVRGRRALADLVHPGGSRRSPWVREIAVIGGAGRGRSRRRGLAGGRTGQGRRQTTGARGRESGGPGRPQRRSGHRQRCASRRGTSRGTTASPEAPAGRVKASPAGQRRWPPRRASTLGWPDGQRSGRADRPARRARRRTRFQRTSGRRPAAGREPDAENGRLGPCARRTGRAPKGGPGVRSRAPSGSRRRRRGSRCAGMRKTIAERLLQSKTHDPAFLPAHRRWTPRRWPSCAGRSTRPAKRTA